jgi:hypothetical protein
MLKAHNMHIQVAFTNRHLGRPLTWQRGYRRNSVKWTMIKQPSHNGAPSPGRSRAGRPAEAEDTAFLHCMFILVFVTKYRRDVLSEFAIRDLSAIFAAVCQDFGREARRMQR